MEASLLFWFRRDLRLEDNRGLSQALAAGRPVRAIFIFDPKILKPLPRRDARVSFIHRALEGIDRELRERGSALHVYHGEPVKVWRRLLGEGRPATVHANEDYEPYARERDEAVARLLRGAGSELKLWKDQVVFGPGEVLKDDGTPYRVFTPYWKRWRARLAREPDALRAPARPGRGCFTPGRGSFPSLRELGFEPAACPEPRAKLPGANALRDYGQTRDRLDLERGTTRLGLHLRFGTVSVRRLAALAARHSEAWLGELAWREFFMQILYHFPRTAREPYDPRFAKFPWRDDARQFARWREGRTGYPVVDAGMRELSETGFMPNRARMIAASFLTKHLLIDWRLGERWFAEKLLDFELSSNVGNWQWVAGSGCDAAPYFRIFNPARQAERFDPEGRYAARWIPELGSETYPGPIVDHEMARRRALAAYHKLRAPRRED